MTLEDFYFPIALAALLGWVLVAGLTWPAIPLKWKTHRPRYTWGSLGEEDPIRAVFCAIFWPLFWLGWVLYQLAMVGTYLSRWRAARRLPRARVVSSSKDPDGN